MARPLTKALFVGAVTGLRRWWPVILIVLTWHFWVEFNNFNTIVMPRPLTVLVDMATNLQVYLPSSTQTVLVSIAGLAIGLALGTALAMLSWWSPLVGGMLTPLSLVASSIPVVTIIPILARIFGYDVKTVIIIVAIISFFPAFVFTTAGLKKLPAGSADVFRALGVSRWKTLVHLALPAAVPSWMVALRIAAPGAILAAMLAEFLMGTSGLGYLFVTSKAEFDMDRALGTSLFATIVSLISFALVSRAEKWVVARRQ